MRAAAAFLSEMQPGSKSVIQAEFSLQGDSTAPWKVSESMVFVWRAIVKA